MMRNHKGTKEGIKKETVCFFFVFFVLTFVPFVLKDFVAYLSLP